MQTLGLFLACLLFLTACLVPPPQATTEIQAVLEDNAIRSGLARVPGGQTITLRIKNQGIEPHSWVLLKDPPSEPFSVDDEANILFEVTLAPGEERTATFRAPAAPGEYSVTSRQPGDLEKGLVGKILVVQPGY